MILSTAQAEAVYAAMVALNNVSGVLQVTVKRDDWKNFTRVYENSTGHVNVIRSVECRVVESERYVDQAAFAVAYKV